MPPPPESESEDDPPPCRLTAEQCAALRNAFENPVPPEWDPDNDRIDLSAWHERAGGWELTDDDLPAFLASEAFPGPPATPRIQFDNNPGVGPKTLAALAQTFPNLETLWLDGCTRLTSFDGLTGKTFPNLETLSLNDCTELTSLDRLTGETFPNLETLWLSGCTELTSLDGLTGKTFPNLKKLSLSGCTGLTSIDGLTGETFHSLETLSLGGCTGLTSIDGLTGETFHSLERLSLDDCIGLTSIDGLTRETLHNLKRLSLGGCTGLTSIDGLTGETFHSLEMLWLDGCTGLTSIDGLTGETFPNLETLWLSGCTELTSLDGLTGKTFPNLKKLSLSGCTGLTSIDGLTGETFHSLETLSLDGCTWFDDVQLGVLAQAYGQGKLPSLRQLYLERTGVTGVAEATLAIYDAQQIFATLQDGIPLNEAKVIIVGNGHNGKTSLRKRLAFDPAQREPFDEKEDSTHDFVPVYWPGIEITLPAIDTGEPPESLGLSESSEPPTVKLDLTVLDFGGQEVLESIHRMFFTGNCIYLLVLKATQTLAKNRLEYWLRMIRHYGEGAPVVVAVTQCEEADRLPEPTDTRRLDLLTLRAMGGEAATTGAIHWAHDVQAVVNGLDAKRNDESERSGQDDPAFTALRNTIHSQIEIHLGIETQRRISPNYHTLRDFYRERGSDWHSEGLRTFYTRCSEPDYAIKEENQPGCLSELHHSATVFHWGSQRDAVGDTPGGRRNPGDDLAWPTAPQHRTPEHRVFQLQRKKLANYVFCRDWVKRQIYRVVRNNGEKKLDPPPERPGVVSLNDILWAFEGAQTLVDREQTAREWEHVMAAMEVFEVCHALDDGDHWFIPALLTTGISDGGASGWQTAQCLRFSFLPESVMERLIVRMMQDGKVLENSAWRNTSPPAYGVTIREPDHQDTIVRVVSDTSRREIRLETPGLHATQTLERQHQRLVAQIKQDIMAIHQPSAEGNFHNKNFTYYQWYGEPFEFTQETQAWAITKALWEAWERAGRKRADLSRSDLAKACPQKGTSAFRPETCFRQQRGKSVHPAWGSMVHKQGEGVDAKYFLDAPRG